MRFGVGNSWYGSAKILFEYRNQDTLVVYRFLADPSAHSSRRIKWW